MGGAGTLPRIGGVLSVGMHSCELHEMKEMLQLIVCYLAMELKQEEVYILFMQPSYSQTGWYDKQE